MLVFGVLLFWELGENDTEVVFSFASLNNSI